MQLMVELGERSYPIVFGDGGLEGLGEAVQTALSAPTKVMVITNSVVAGLWLDDAVDSLEKAGMDVACFEIPDGESHKTLKTWAGLVDSLLEAGADRSTPVLALGGGVTGDIAGFVAATFMRGVPWIQVPTTLLAMVDSSVGGKTGVNRQGGKNLVGAFHQPSLVYTAMGTLRTLSDREFQCGLGEVVKHGVLADPRLFDLCESESGRILAREPALLLDIVERNCRVKIGVVQQDEREGHWRAVLNLGHTVGHAIESALLETPGEMPHGHCVGIGLIAEAEWAANRGDCERDVPERIASVLGGLGLPTEPGPLDMAAVIAAAKVDKKVRCGKLRTPIIEAIGRVRLTEIDVGELSLLFHSFPG